MRQLLSMEPNHFLLEIPNLLDEKFYASELFVTLKSLAAFMAKDPCDYRTMDDTTLKEFRIWTIQKACDPEISVHSRQVAKNWFHVIEELSEERNKILEELFQ